MANVRSHRRAPAWAGRLGITVGAPIGKYDIPFTIDRFAPGTGGHEPTVVRRRMRPTGGDLNQARCFKRTKSLQHLLLGHRSFQELLDFRTDTVRSFGRL